MSNRADNFEQLYDGRNVITDCLRRIEMAPELLKAARDAQYGTQPTDLYAEAARQAEAISEAQRPESGNVVPLNAQTASNQALQFARPSNEIHFGDAA